MTKREAAAAALAAHDNLRAAYDTEPELNEDGLPVDVNAWLAWRHNVSIPAYDSWCAAMNDLDAALGEPVGRHPFTFRPICEELLA